MSPGQFADALAGFLDGTGSDWDWDELENVKFYDSELERIRQEYILGTAGKGPPFQPGQYASEEGQKYLREVIEMLRKLEERRSATK